MAFSSGKTSLTISEILNRVTEGDLLSFYLGISEVPCVINSPLRPDDKHPSFSIYSRDGNKISYKDFGSGETGGIFDLLCKMWSISIKEVIDRINRDIPHMHSSIDVNTTVNRYRITASSKVPTVDLQCKVREWRDYDLKYWESYGITLQWLKFADIYPISHKIVIKNNRKYVLSADKLAYAYVEHKEGNTTLKIYQPFNTKGFKWSNKHDSSVISLWSKLPKEGQMVCICSSVKDALCLWANVGIPSIAIQGEAYSISNSALQELKKRFKQLFILLDNDLPGIKDAEKLSKETGFTNIVLPQFEKGKDISDYYLYLNNPIQFKQNIINLFNFNNYD